MAIRKAFWGLEESKCDSYLEEDLGGSKELWAGQPPYSEESGGVNKPKKLLQIWKEQEGDWA